MKFKSVMSGGRQQIALSGDLLGGAAPELASMLGQIEAKTVDFDCAEIRQINSTGVRAWRLFLRDLEQRAAYRFFRCPVFFIDYANLIPDLLGGGTIETFEAPLRCDACNRSETVILTAAAALQDRSFGVHHCQKCHGLLTPEVAPEDYLAFLGFDP